MTLPKPQTVRLIWCLTCKHYHRRRLVNGKWIGKHASPLPEGFAWRQR